MLRSSNESQLNLLMAQFDLLIQFLPDNYNLNSAAHLLYAKSEPNYVKKNKF